MKKYGGLIRWKFTLPLLCVVALALIYGLFFFDQQLRWGLEKVLSQANGAEVNIRQLKTSFTGTYLELTGIELTDPERADYNRLEIGKMRFDLSGEHLLYGRLVIEDASTLDIKIQAKRAKSGFVLPPPPPEPEGPGLKEQAMSLYEPLKKQALANAMTAFKSQGIDFSLQGLNWDELPSRQELQKIEANWKSTEQNLKQMLQGLPKEAELKALRSEVKGLSMPKDPLELPAKLQEVEAMQAKVKAQLAQVETVSQSVQKAGKDWQNQLTGLNQLIQQDLAVLKEKLKLPDLDFKELAEDIAGPEIKRYVRMLEFYYLKLKPYLESKEKAAPPRPLRRAGREISFPQQKGAPAFWLKKMQISSKETADGPLGNILGKLEHLSSDPSLLSTPTTLDIEGDFPQSRLRGLKIFANLDHRTGNARDSFTVSLASFPIAERVLSASEDFTLGLYEAAGQVNLQLVLDRNELELAMETQWRSLRWRVESSQQKVQALLDQSLGPLTEVGMKAQAKGPIDKLKWEIESDIAKRLKENLRAAMMKELAQLEEKLKAEAMKRLELEKKKLETKLRAEWDALQQGLLPAQSEGQGAMNDAEGIKAQMQNLVEGKKAEVLKKAEAEKAAAIQKAEAEKKKQEDAAKDKAKEQIKSKVKIPGL